ncbi:hypothetical protein VOLCADRAFT_100710 [Volvox carteri f. nagariensis]|uniref:Uncharacterized protein n=1 Tax=Volvox carteri f. nagariensis TaxID=3068 RepID=D8UKU6_VOLCA|nr:uncharacterized protein VOLCADRAFT_100710 [Volvox carteri f. nagariensis]EFJ39651.1 hypothetical protein VOLCADRAFT_100710 [Volvox carteri f. nagariensis]|eukprot:XP_002959281.1 hypothetical protein VOLCADRAFT_100710 [Volvox carteri f. nagariensis]
MPRHAFSAIKCCLHMLACSPWPVDHQLRASHPQQLHLVIHMKNTQHLILAARHVRRQSTLQFNMPEHSSLPAWVLLACGKAHITSDMHLDLLPTHMCFRHMEQQTRSKCMSWVLGALLHANNTQAGRNECYGVVNFKVLCPVQIDAKAHAHSRETSKQVQVYVLGIRCIVACQ